MKFNSSILNVKANSRGNMEITNPKRKDESISPKMTAHKATGQHSNLSRVLERVSHGTIDGPTEVAVKNVVMPISPGSTSLNGMFLPIT
jgi:hypothetical protein